MAKAHPRHHGGLIGKGVKGPCGCATVSGEPVGKDATVQQMGWEGVGQAEIRKPGNLPGLVELYSAPNR